MRFVKISQTELQDIKNLYEGVMSQACHGLFFREGAVLGKEIADISSKNRDNYFSTASRLLKARGWVEEIKFEEEKATAKGSFEVIEGAGNPTCHRLRGIVREIYENYLHTKVQCTEEKCISQGNENCIFEIKKMGD